MAERQRAFDLIRGFAMIFIVVHHVDDYASGVFNSGLDTLMTYIALGLFVFISGWLASVSRFNKPVTGRGSLGFLSNRLVRLYPLSLLALFLFWLLGIGRIDGWLVASAILLVNTLLAPTESNELTTLWFVSLIWLYYCCHVFVFARYRTALATGARIAVLGSALLLLRILLGMVDSRLPLYLPLFLLGGVVGMSTRWKSFLLSKGCLSWSLFGLVVASILYIPVWNIPRSPFRVLFSVAAMFFSLAPSYQIAAVLTRKESFYKFVLLLSYASYCMYLFHRVVFFLLLELAGPFKNDIGTVGYLIIIGLPATYLFALALQVSYDKALLPHLSSWVKNAAGARQQVRL